MLWRITCSCVQRVGRADPFINFLGLVAGVYLAGGNLYKASDKPSKVFWATSALPWKLLLIAAVFVPVVAFYKYLDARCAKEEQRRTEIKKDAAVFCQRVAARIAEECAAVELTKVVVSILLCGKKGKLDPVGEFALAGDARAWPVRWRRDLGVAGTAWALAEEGQLDEQALVVNLEQLRDLGRFEFERLPKEERYGLDWAQLGNTVALYKGTVAAPVRSAKLQGRRSTLPAVLAILVIDYTGTDHSAAGFGCVGQTVTTGLTQLLASMDQGLDRLLNAK